ncbi:23S rRNA (uracil(1939)-C(5))-methyltransferase RlmD [Pseudemcibacter aquimaris]|uniref:23S rRNA (uracil(1939)-C(5))-methyltransferase RlmD n=1 Tax=Pseudemcibacter aquimaris TaxID=2857064 RepID=UPI0020118156|nr:23S rRNA (uracil(1939)-C(5))-methyltransferase RlmD [Pseudemcibacter aquimaris]MCC3861314.1 23S rRNA (uracil(1939)-C(5))-methyltransferase RlmD [Pseudemcibacter aquimaris]WDU58087.1 23S rRNA (uracil(1939)-C(5))-methyltransferase RlmD [Pseudemcibacter aquimaris]
MNHKVTINEIGGRGDGLAEVDGKTIYIPYTVPGDVIDAKIQGSKGKLRHIHQKSTERAEPICKHFGKCGGCLLQHINADYYKNWKEGLIRTALAHQGSKDADIAPIKVSPMGSRRRTTFQAIGRGNGNIVFGYAEKGSHNLIDVFECPILAPELVALIGPIKKLISGILDKKEKMSVSLTLAENGIDMMLKGKGDPSLNLRMDLAEFAEKHDLARISWFDTKLKKGQYELLAERKKPYVTFEGNKVYFPSGSFLQATQQGQDALINAMLDGIGDASKVVDLFSGCGTFSIAAANSSNVHAVENNEEMLTALKLSANQMTGIKKVTTELRDLFKRPLLPHELNEFDAAIIDPPRAGAKHQMEEIIKSDIQKLVMISCNPITFSRDVQSLIDAGFEMGAVTPVDQFLYAPHLEIVSVFTR